MCADPDRAEPQRIGTAIAVVNKLIEVDDDRVVQDLRVVGTLGKGMYGVVLECIDLQHGITVAVKYFPDSSEQVRFPDPTLRPWCKSS